MTGLLLEPSSQMERLFEGISEGNIQTDAQILTMFPEFNGNVARVAVLKSKLKDRLLDAVLLLDLGNTASDDREKAFNECHRRYATAMILTSKGCRASAINILEDLLRKTLRFELTELSLDVLRSLSRQYAFFEGEKKKYERIEAIMAQQEAIYEVERKIEQLYKDLINDYVRKKMPKEQLQAKAADYASKAIIWMNRYETYWIQFVGRLLEITLYDSLGESAQVVRLSESAIAFFEKKLYNSTGAFQAFHNYLFAALISLRQYEQCDILLKKSEKKFQSGTFNWFKLQELRFCESIRNQHYEQARTICATAIQHPEYTQQGKPIWEIWKIFEAIIAFLVEAKVLIQGNFPSNFRIGRFINEIELFSYDKSGMNVHVLMIQFLFDLLGNNPEKSLGRLDALAKYRLRHLSDPANIRINIFIRMLKQLPKARFRADLADQKIKSLMIALKAHPLESLNQNYEVEIIPYENLWDLVKTILGFHSRQ